MCSVIIDSLKNKAHINDKGILNTMMFIVVLNNFALFSMDCIILKFCLIRELELEGF